MSLTPAMMVAVISWPQVQTSGMTKGQLRTQLLRWLKQQKEEERRRRSEAIWRKMVRLTAFRQAKVVCCYVALPYEVQTWQMIEAMLARGKRVVVPAVDVDRHELRCVELTDPQRDLRPGTFGVLEPRVEGRTPVSVRAIDLVLVPGLAFDRRGHRLGHGYGYFDRFLARLPGTTTTVGLAFQFQLLDHLPVTSHDHAVQKILSA